jgi:hypothetical protein
MEERSEITKRSSPGLATDPEETEREMMTPEEGALMGAVSSS